jgi:predicted O-methyltransferase YrrM
MKVLNAVFDMVDRYLGRKENKIDMVWYDGSKPTKQRIAELRYKLAVSRGMLIALYNEWIARGYFEKSDNVQLEEINKAINESAD